MGWMEDIVTTIQAYVRGCGIKRIWHIDRNLYQSGTLEIPFSNLILRHNKIEGVVDLRKPEDPSSVIGEVDWYQYFPIEDGPLPWKLPNEPYNEFVFTKWCHLVQTANNLSLSGTNVLVHCGAGRNRASLFSGCILYLRGLKGDAIVDHIRKHRPGALSNSVFKGYLRSLK